MPTKKNSAPVTEERKKLLEKLHAKKAFAAKERLGFISDDFFGTSTKPRAGAIVGMLHAVNNSAGGTSRKGGELVSFNVSE
jgi:hypothetical protein